MRFVELPEKIIKLHFINSFIDYIFSYINCMIYEIFAVLKDIF